ASSPRARGLCLGAWFALTTLVIHSFVDVVVHSPALLMLGVFIAAYLCGLGASRERTEEPGPRNSPADDPQAACFCLRNGTSILAAAGASIALGAFVCAEGWKAYRSQHWLLASVVPPAHSEFVAPEKKIAYLQAATAMLPTSARLHMLLAEAHLEVCEQHVS